MGFIQAYTHYLTPFISSQNPSFDAVGEMTRDPSYLFYYLMSWPLRLISMFTSSYAIQLIFLRLISLAFVVVGLINYRKVFLAANIPRSVTHLTLAFFMLTPTIALFPGAVHYDNAIFMLFAFCLLLALRILKSAKPNAKQILLLSILGMLGALIKFTFIALFVPILLYIAYDQWKKHGRQWWSKFSHSFKSLKKPAQIGLIAAFAISLGLFIERPVQNILVYKQIQPDCQKIMPKDRCTKNYTAERNIDLLDKKPVGFKPINPFQFTLSLWSISMISTEVNFIPATSPLPNLLYLYYTFALGGILLVFFYLRDFLKVPALRFLLVTCGAYTALLFLYLFTEYAKYSEPIALSSRYLFQVQPLFMVFVALAIAKLLANKQKTRLLTLLVVSLIFTQGGGISSMLVLSDKTHYWNDTTYSINQPLSDIVDKFISEQTPYQN